MAKNERSCCRCHNVRPSIMGPVALFARILSIGEAGVALNFVDSQFTVTGR